MNLIHQPSSSSRTPLILRGADRRHTPAAQRRQTLRTPELRGVNATDIDVDKFLACLPIAPVQAVPYERRHEKRRAKRASIFGLLWKWARGHFVDD